MPLNNHERGWLVLDHLEQAYRRAAYGDPKVPGDPREHLGCIAMLLGCGDILNTEWCALSTQMLQMQASTGMPANNPGADEITQMAGKLAVTMIGGGGGG